MLRILHLSSLILVWILSTSFAGEEFGGLGVNVTQLYDPSTESKAGNLVVMNVLPGTDAQEKGIQKGDVIVEIDGQKIKGVEFSTLVVERLRGEIGTTSSLKIRRTGTDSLINLEVKRTRVSYPSKK